MTIFGSKRKVKRNLVDTKRSIDKENSIQIKVKNKLSVKERRYV